MSETSTQPAQPPVRPGKSLRWALIASLAVNLAVAGMALGAFFHGHPGERGNMVRDLGFGPFDEALRPEDRTALRAAMRSKLADLQASRAAVATDTAAILAALRSDPFDAAALDTALSAQGVHLGERMKLGNDTIRDYLAGLPQKDRLAFADRLEQRMRHGKDPAAPAN